MGEKCLHYGALYQIELSLYSSILKPLISATHPGTSKAELANSVSTALKLDLSELYCGSVIPSYNSFHLSTEIHKDVLLREET